MIAELHKKISRKGSNLSERLEDQLTGDVFGSLRYLPFEEGLGRILSRISIKHGNLSEDKLYKLISEVKGYKGFECQFWKPRTDYGEIDLLIEAKELVLGIEVKYKSGLSGDDEEKEEEEEHSSIEESSNQLAKYAKMLNTYFPNISKIIILVAPLGTGNIIIENSLQKIKDWGLTTVGFLSWQAILMEVSEMEEIAKEEWKKLMLKDIKKLLIKKGFEHFRGFRNSIKPKINRHKFFGFRNIGIHWKRGKSVKKEGVYEFR